MKIFKLLFIIFFLSSLLFSFYTEGGNITELNNSLKSNSSFWSGLYGDVLSGNPNVIPINLLNNEIVRKDLNYSLNPGCYAVLYGVILSNSTIIPPLKPGNLSLLDNMINSSENASLTFANTESLETSYGNLSNIPYTYTLPISSSFKTYYLNDANNNLIFYSNIQNNKPDWNSTTSDYQMIFPSTISFSLFVDGIQNCNFSAVPRRDKKHSLFVYEIPSVYAYIGELISIPIHVKNDGYYTQPDVYLKSDYPTTNFFAYFDRIRRGEIKTANLSFKAKELGNFTVKITAYSDNARHVRTFYLYVSEQCKVDDDCNPGYFCSFGVCKKKKNFCESDNQCSLDEKCVENTCQKISCECGEISNRECIPYECCSDLDCSLNEVCFQNKCVEFVPNITYNTTPIEGEKIDILVYDQNGNPFEGKLIVEGEEYEIIDGKVSFKVPKEGLVFILKGNQRYGIYIKAKGKAYINLYPYPVIVNTSIKGTIVDDKGNRVGKAQIFLYKKGELISTFYTKNDSSFIFVVEDKVNYTLKGKADGYVIEEISFVPIDNKDILQQILTPILSFSLLLLFSYFIWRFYLKKNFIIGKRK